uniref:DDE-1 domain-containing protein n=1 Tax=Amphimedon queenslandica TaxID=400682 RepID=A0A1X7VPU5_AMPQE
MQRKGSTCVELSEVDDKRQVTAVFCVAATGEFLPIQLIYEENTPRCHPNFEFPSTWHIKCSPRCWSTEETLLHYIQHIIVQCVEGIRNGIGDNDKLALVIMDNCKGKTTESVRNMLEDYNIHSCNLLPCFCQWIYPSMSHLKTISKRGFKNGISLKGVEFESIEEMDLEPIDLSLAVMKDVGANWLVGMAHK